MRQILCPAVVGRDEERELLENALRAAREGHGRLVLIQGEAGVGKSRLTLQLEAAARSAGMRVLRGRAVPSSSPIPFRPFAEALLGATRESGPPEARELAAYRSVLGVLIPEWAESVAPTAAGLMLHEAALRLLRVIGGTPGVLVTLEDLHWADAETLALVEYLADNVASERILCVATIRSDEPLPTRSLSAVLAARRNALIVSPGRLSDPEVDAMARAALDLAALPEGLAPLISSRSEGVPFLVEEVLASCVASGALERKHGVWSMRRDRMPGVSETFQEMIRDRLRDVDEEQRAVLGAAAVIGRSFDWSLIPEIISADRKTVLSALRSAINAQIVSPEDSGEGPAFRFRHALTREAVLADLLPPERIELAARAAATVERMHPGLPGPWCERAADLRELAGERNASARLLIESARRSLARTALASAEVALDRARSIVADEPDLVVEIDEALLEVLSLAGKSDRAVEVGRRLTDALTAMPADPARLGAVHLAVAHAEVAAGRWDEAWQQGLEAGQAARSAGDEGLLARVLALESQVQVWRGDHTEATRLAKDALEIAERADAAEAACEALDVLGRQAQGRQHFDEALAIFDRAARIAEVAGLTLWRIRALLEAGTVEWLKSGNTDTLLVARELAEKSGAVWALASIEQNLSWAYLFAARLDELEESNGRCVELSRRFQLGTLAHALVVTAGLRGLQGRRKEMDRALEEAVSSTDDLNVLGGAQGWRGMISLLDENRDEAVILFEEAIDHIRASGRRSGLWMNWHFIGTRALLLEVHNPAAGARDELRDAPMAPACWTEAAVHYADAVANGRTGRASEAQEDFARADGLISWAPLLFHLYRRLVAEAALADGWGHPETWLTEALSFFRDLGQERSAAACRGLLRKAGAPVPRKSPVQPEVPGELQSMGVTARELDVLRLLVDGLPNGEIARRLFVSPRTVESHVTSLLRRMGARNRGQLISMASRLL